MMTNDRMPGAGRQGWRRLVLPALLALVCGHAAVGQEVRPALPAQAAADSWDAQAKFLAGVPLPEGVPLAALQKSSSYREHASLFEKMWARYNEHYFTPMRAWSAAELAPKIPYGAPLFYFFGGPDALAAMAYYPEAREYVLGGLEPVGVVPPPGSLGAGRMGPALQSLRGSTNVILSCGFFITKEMKAELERAEFRGVLPLLMTFVAMSGGEVLDVNYFAIGKDGVEENLGAAPVEVRGKIPGVRVTFRRSPTAAPQKISYVQADASNDGLGSGAAVLTWAASLGRGNVYLKAASYLMHEDYFTRIRKFLLGQADSVLQDDSGMPLKVFQDGGWRCWYFGKYNGTLDLFKKYYQPDMVKAFSKSDGPLPFGTGYKWRVGESNLMLAVPQVPPKAEPVTAPAQ